MSKLPCRVSIAQAALLVVLLCSRPSHAQVVVVPEPPRVSNSLLYNLVTGAQYDILNQELAEHHLQRAKARLRSDRARGDSAAVDRDLRLIHKLQYRIVVHESLIRVNSEQHAGYYPLPLRMDPLTCSAFAYYGRPPQAP